MAGAHENDGNSPDDLPDLPEEWGVIVIPDDLSELSDEVEAIRAELRQTDRSTRWRRLFDRPGLRQVRQLGLALLRAPVLIISMAVLVTVASLFASAWPGPPRQPVVQRTGDDHLDSLPALDLVDDNGQMVPLRAKLPAVVLVTDGCDCDELVSATAAAAQDRPQIAIVVIGAALSGAASTGPSAGRTAAGAANGASSTNGASAANGASSTAGAGAANGASAATSTTGASAASGAGSGAGAGKTNSASGAPNQGPTQAAGNAAGPSGRATPATQTTPQTRATQTVRMLRDTAGNNVREQLKLGAPDGTAAALIVDGSGRVVKEFPRTASVEDIQPYLSRI
jgi:hypothetical protein